MPSKALHESEDATVHKGEHKRKVEFGQFIIAKDPQKMPAMSHCHSTGNEKSSTSSRSAL